MKSGKRTQKIQKIRTTQSEKAGITFPIGRIGRYMRVKSQLRVSSDGPVYLAAIMEYLCAEVLEVSGYICKKFKKKRIIPRHIELSIRNDSDFGKMFQNKTFANAGKMPLIDFRLFAKQAIHRQVSNFNNQ